MTTDATPTELFLDGAGTTPTQRITIEEARAVTFDIQVVAISDGASANFAAGFHIRGIIRRFDPINSINIIGTPIKEVLGVETGAWDVNVSADVPNNALKVTVTGDPTRPVRWVATVRTTEVQFP